MESQSSSRISPEIAGVTYPNMLRYVKFVLGLTAQHMKNINNLYLNYGDFFFMVASSIPDACSMVLEYLATFTEKNSPSFVATLW